MRINAQDPGSTQEARMWVALGAQRGEEVVRRVTAWGVRDP
jgi:hypothetical protein